MWKAKILDAIRNLDPKGEVLRVFDLESQKVEFANCIKEHQRQKWEDEVYVRAYLVLRLVKELKYP